MDLDPDMPPMSAADIEKLMKKEESTKFSDSPIPREHHMSFGWDIICLVTLIRFSFYSIFCVDNTKLIL